MESIELKTLGKKHFAVYEDGEYLGEIKKDVAFWNWRFSPEDRFWIGPAWDQEEALKKLRQYKK